MIKLVDARGTESFVEVKHFPDGTQNPLFQEAFENLYSGLSKIVWNYEKEEELITLVYLVNWFKENYDMTNLVLEMPYIPNARMDRIKNKEDVFTLKYFATILNSLNFKEIRVLDPHSYVSPALINNVVVFTPERYILKVMHETGSNYICYPDHGSEKRYSKTIKVPFVCGVKNRDWKTRKILSLSLIDNGLDVKDRNILIVDDIIGTGGTIVHIAEKLKELGVAEINIYASHIEKTVTENEDFRKLVKDKIINKVYTPDFLPKDVICSYIEEL